jgi:hypothetical protein
VDEIYHWFISIFDTQDNPHTSTNSTLTIAIPPEITINEPEPIYYSSKYNLPFDYTITDDGIGINRSLYYVTNSTGDIIIANTTLTNPTDSITFNVPRDDIYNITLWSIDNKNNSNSTTVEFGVYSLGPVIHLQTPIDNSWTTIHSVNFSFTLTDLNSMSICTIYTNYTGEWNPFYTFFPPITNNGTMSVVRNVASNGYYLYNVWCMDSAGLNNFALNNFKFGVDDESPEISINTPNGTYSSLTVPYNVLISDDVSSDECRYWVTRGASLEIVNTTIPCENTNGTFLVSSDLTTYTFHLFANDSTGNSNYTSTIFNVQTTSPSTGGSGGTTEGKNQTAEFSILTTNYLDYIDIILAKDSIRAREKEFLLVNKINEPVTVNVFCSEEGIERINTRNISICDYVEFEQTEFTLSTSTQDPSYGSFKLKTPPDSSIGDEYYFNIYATSDSKYSKLSVSARITWLAYFYKWSYFPFTEFEYPVWVLSLFLSFVSFFLVFFIFSKIKKQAEGFWIGIAIFTLTFALSIYLF